MKTKFIVVAGMVTLLAMPSCTYQKSETNGAISKEKKITWFTKTAKPAPCEFSCEEPKACCDKKQDKEKKCKKEAKARIPKFWKCKAEKAVNYEIMINGGTTMCYSLKLGKFEATNAEMEMYSTLAQNGLVTITNEAVMNPAEKYTNWVNVALTEQGKKYVFNGDATDLTKKLDKSLFTSIFKPAKNRDKYGDLFEDQNVDSKVKELILDFYAQYVVDQAAAVQKYGESELAEAYVRMAKADSCCKVLNRPSLMPENVFTAGKQVAGVDSVICRVPKFNNTYKVNLPKGSVYVILNEDEDKIFDVVEKFKENKTFKKTNQNVKDSEIKALYDAVKAKDKAAKDKKNAKAGKSNEYAPGLVSRTWTANGLVEAKREGFVYEEVNGLAVDYTLPVVLYNTEVDRIYKVTYTAEREDTTAYYSIPKYNAEATVVFKKVNLTPFQFVLQNFEKVEAVAEDGIYTPVNVYFTYYKDCGWVL